MSWTVRLVILLLFVSCQSYGSLAQSAIPWSNPTLAESFADAFVQNLNTQQGFTADQLDDMSTIAQSMVQSIQSLAARGKTSPNRLQALNMGFASSMAEIAASEEGGGSLSTKTTSIANAMSNAFLQTTGEVNQQFINEITRLINMFAQASATSHAASSQGPIHGGYGQGAGAGAAAAGATAAGAGGARGSGQGGYNQGAVAESAAAAAAASGAGQGGLGGYGQGAVAGARAAATASGDGGGYGGQVSYGQGAGFAGAGGAEQGGYGQGTGSGSAGASSLDISTTVGNTVSRLYSPSAASRVSSAVSSLVSNDRVNLAALPNIISNLSSSISASTLGASECEILVQVLLEVVSALLHILSSSDIGYVDQSTLSDIISVIGSAVAAAIS